MHKVLLPLLALFSGMWSRPACAQTNGWLPDGTSWLIWQACSGPPPTPPCINYLTHLRYVLGDTVLDGHTYKKTYWRKHLVEGPGSAPPSFCDDDYVAADSTNSTIYLRDSLGVMYRRTSTDSTDLLLYDFNLDLGDTIPLMYYWNEGYHVVAALDSMLMDDGYHKKFITEVPGLFLLEGVGTGFGLFFPISMRFFCDAELLCYAHGDSAYWPAEGLPCTLDLNISEPGQASQELVVFPVPGDLSLTVTAPFQLIGLTLFDMQGREVWREAPYVISKSIDLGPFPNGSYFLRVELADGTAQTGRVVVQHQ